MSVFIEGSGNGRGTADLREQGAGARNATPVRAQRGATVSPAALRRAANELKIRNQNLAARGLARPAKVRAARRALRG